MCNMINNYKYTNNAFWSCYMYICSEANPFLTYMDINKNKT